MARPRKDQQIDVRGRAIEETISLLRGQSAADITLQQVASAVGCRAPALYNHFQNKEALLLAVHDAGFERLYKHKLAAAVKAKQGGFERLRAGGHAYIMFALENPSLYRLMFEQPQAQNATRAENPFEKDLGLKSLMILKESIEKCKEEGYLVGHDAELVAFTLWSTVHGAAWLMLQNRSPLAGAARGTKEDLAEQTVDLMMKLIGATKAPEGNIS